jgi:hypothetical protein
MAPRRSENQCWVVLKMHKKANSYSKISTVLGIPCSTYSDIVQKFGERRDLRDRYSHGRL